MNKIIKNFLSIFFILINTINISAITYAELKEYQQDTYDRILGCSIENNIQEFINILAIGNNFELTNVSKPSLVKEIIDIQDPEVNKQNFIHALYLYGMLSEVVQQVEVGTRIKRFSKIYEQLIMWLDKNIPIYPPLIEIILSSGRESENPTSFLWYISEFVIGNNNILNPCFEESLNWFVNTTIEFAFNVDIEAVIKNLEMAPLIIKIKYEGSNLIDEIRELLGENLPDYIITNINERLRKPSICTAFLRYNIFT